MPLIVQPNTAVSCTLPDCIAAIAELGFDPAEPESVEEVAEWLMRLTNNRTFLADVLIDRLSGRSDGQIESGYGPQAIMLSPKIGNMFLRANIWPAEHDLWFQNSGAKTFVYGAPHDHNFSFLTSGYSGPGYRSDYYEYDYEDVAGFAGEPVALRFIERSTLHQGKVMLYRAHHDIHSQLPPEALSVSLNVMHVDPAQSWFDQYGFDLDRHEITRVLSPNATEAFLRVAIGLGAPTALNFAEWVENTHPSDRLRLASFEARASRALDRAEEDGIWRQAELTGVRMLEAIAERRRSSLEVK